MIKKMLPLLLAAIPLVSFGAPNQSGEGFVSGALSVMTDANSTASAMLAWRNLSEGKPDAIAQISKLAKEGNPTAQNLLGYCLDNGVATPQDSKTAARWFEAAAEKNPLAAYNLGVLLWKGRGVQLDQPKALSLFKQASDKANIEQATVRVLLEGVSSGDKAKIDRYSQKAAALQNPIGLYYTGRLLVEKGRYKEAHAMLLRSAAAMDSNAANLLSYLYSEGLVGKNPVMAAAWKQVAVASSRSGMTGMLNQMSELTEAQRGEAKRFAEDWISSHRNYRLDFLHTLPDYAAPKASLDGK